MTRGTSESSWVDARSPKDWVGGSPRGGASSSGRRRGAFKLPNVAGSSPHGGTSSGRRRGEWPHAGVQKPRRSARHAGQTRCSFHNRDRERARSSLRPRVEGPRVEGGHVWRGATCGAKDEGGPAATCGGATCGGGPRVEGGHVWSEGRGRPRGHVWRGHVWRGHVWRGHVWSEGRGRPRGEIRLRPPLPNGPLVLPLTSLEG